MAAQQPHPVSPANASAVASATKDAYGGFTARETSGAGTAAFRLRDGSGGTILETVSLAAAESRSDHYPGGRSVSTNVYFEFVAGAFELTVFTAA